MIEIEHGPLVERFLTPAEVARSLPSRRQGQQVSATTVSRWMVSGLRNGQVFLKSRLIGGTRCTTAADLQRFFDELTALDEAERHRLVDEPPLSPAKAKRFNDKRHVHYEKLAAERNL